jgi:hypothetical protein
MLRSASPALTILIPWWRLRSSSCFVARDDEIGGWIEKCPIDRLVNMLAAVGHHVSLAVGKAA